MVEDALPGMEDAIRPIGTRPGEIDMRDEKRFTAAVLFRDHPQVVKSICVLRFKRGLPVSWISEALQVSEHTVNAIENSVLEMPTTDEARAAFFIKSGVNRSRRIANRIALETLRKRLEEKPDSLSVAEILNIIEATKENDSDVDNKKMDIVDAEFVDSFDNAINGLKERKKSAEDDDPEDECSTSNKKQCDNSL